MGAFGELTDSESILWCEQWSSVTWTYYDRYNNLLREVGNQMVYLFGCSIKRRVRTEWQEKRTAHIWIQVRFRVQLTAL